MLHSKNTAGLLLRCRPIPLASSNSASAAALVTSSAVYQQRRAFALVQKKVQKNKAPGEIKLLPFIPTELVKETMSFFSDARKCKAMLELVFSPHSPSETEKDRSAYEKQRRRYLDIVAAYEEALEQRRRAMYESTFNAIQALPADLYDEAVASGNVSIDDTDKTVVMPNGLLFNQLYKKDIFGKLTFQERKRLQVFMNLMHVRYPHTEVKKEDPEKFWVQESQYMSRQREQAMKRNRLKPAK